MVQDRPWRKSLRANKSSRKLFWKTTIEESEEERQEGRQLINGVVSSKWAECITGTYSHSESWSTVENTSPVCATWGEGTRVHMHHLSLVTKVGLLLVVGVGGNYLAEWIQEAEKALRPRDAGWQLEAGQLLWGGKGEGKWDSFC
jgi:hypothetical protein